MRTLADGGPVRREVFESTDGTFRWIDIISPDRSVLLKLQEELGLPEIAAEDCLDARQLPKHERHGGIMFMILRAHVDPVPEFAANSYELTQPLVVCTGPGFLLTIHRREHSVLARLRSHYESVGPELEHPATAVLDDVITAALLTFQGPLDQLTRDLEAFEDSLLRAKLTEAALEQIFVRKRRASVLAMLLMRTRELVGRAHAPSDRTAPLVQELREIAESLHFRARELVEYTESLLNLQIAIASHRTNEVMRLLTLMSVIFMPLTFIVGVYGMNFEMPEFGWRYGYLLVYALLGIVVMVIWGWFRRRGWLR